MMVPDGTDGLRTMVMDFGLSRDLDASVEDTYSMYGPSAIVGTVPYMAPEQLRGKAASRSSDIYALGVVLFEMVTGRLPFDGATPLAVSLQKLQNPVPEPREFVSDLPENWNATILACMAEDTVQRPASGAEIIEFLEGTREAPRPPRRSRRWMLAASVSVVIGGSAAAWQVLHREPPLNAEAVASCKRGDESARRRDNASVNNAIREYKRALESEPRYGDAWAGLSDAYAAAAHFSFIEPATAREEARKAARQAIQINPRLGKAQGALAYAESIELSRWRSTEPYFQQAIKFNPNEPITRVYYANFLGRSLRHNEAIEQARFSVQLDPGAFYTNHQHAQEYYRARRFDEFLPLAVDLVRLQPFHWSGHISLARAYEWKGRLEEALGACAEAQKYTQNAAVLCVRATIQAKRGEMTVARQLAAEV